MFRLHTPRGAPHDRRWTRRTVMEIGALSLAGLARGAPEGVDGERSGILLFLVGAPSHIDTFDPKPGAPAEVRGPFKPVSTRVPGMQISEMLPKIAAQADKFSIVRSVYHTSAAVHEIGRAHV